HADRFELVVLDRRGVVEEHHQPVTREMLESAVVRRNQLADQAVILPQEFELFFGSRRLREGRRATEITEEARDIRTVPRQQLLASLAREQRGDLRRHGARKLPAL